MQLSAADRRTVIEDILDIQVFSNMNSVLRDKTSATKTEINEITRQLSINKERGTGLVNLVKSLEKKSDEQLVTLNEELSVANQTRGSAENEITALDDKISELLLKISDEKTVNQRIQKYSQARMRMNREIKENEKNSKFYTDHKNCPTCHQEISEESRAEATAKADNTIETLNAALAELEEMEQKQVERSNEISEVQKQIEDLKSERIAHITTERNARCAIKAIEGKKEKLQQSEEGDIQDVKAQLEKVMEDREKLIKRKEELLVKQNTFTHAGHMLKDSGIKAKVIRYYLPIINALVNKHLKEMDFYVSFDLDENFNETIKSRHRDNFSYMSFSEGEKMRIDLAILLAWREVSRLKNSANTNLLILDEVFDASLDAIGSDDFLKLLDNLSTRSHIFVISHKADQLVDKFQNQVSFQKQGNFSRLV
jgi:DNA repair exonuclease SbcCD ATPase subunit